MKKITALLLSFILIFSTTAAFAAAFTDTSGHWAEAEIEKAYENKAVNGDTDGSFRPDDNISRAEFMKMVTAVVAGKFQTEIPEAQTSAHWADKYYNFAVQAYLPVNANVTYDDVSPAVMSQENYDLPIKRWEMAYILNQALKNVFMLELAPAEDKIKDLEAIKTTYDESVSGSISNLVGLEVISGDENGNFNAANSGTRAESAVLINRASDLMDEVNKYFETLAKQQEEAYKQKEAEINENVKTYTSIPKGHPVVEFTMSDGQRFEITLYPEYAPQTCANFLYLVSSKFYDGLPFHRIIEGFVAQGGDPSGDGSGGADYNIIGEFAENGFTDNSLKHEKGVVSMARSSIPNSGSSQFFVCYDTLPDLDGKYAAFGKVTKGMEVVESFLDNEFKDNGLGELSAPANPVKIGKAVIKKK